MKPTGKQPRFTPGPWRKWQLAPDSDPEQRTIIVAADGDSEVCGIGDIRRVTKEFAQQYLVGADEWHPEI